MWSNRANTGKQRHPQDTRLAWFHFVLSRNLLTPEIEHFEYPGTGSDDDPFLVSWLPGKTDPRNPKNFSLSYRWTITILNSMSCFAIAFTSSAYTGGIPGIIQHFGVSNVIAQLGVTLYVIGFAVGPLFWAPFSEMYGRQIIFLMTFGLLVLFNALSAAAQSIGALLAFRALAGIVGSSLLTNAGGVIADMFETEHRGLAMGLFSFGPYMGPVMGPIVGGYLGALPNGWRYVLWLCTGLCGILWVLCAATTPETFAPLMLARRAAALSSKTGQKYVSHVDQSMNGEMANGKKRLSSMIWIGLLRPWALLIYEPIVLLISIYMAIVYATMYMLFAAYPTIFRAGRGWSAGQTGLAFIPMAVGLVIALVYMIYENERYKRRIDRMAAEGKGRAQPEARLPVCMAGSLLVPIGLFWFAWANAPSTHWIVCLLGTTVFGIGNVLLYLSAMNYLVDSYLMYAASCLAGSSVLRSVLGAAFPLFTDHMYKTLGIHWASSIPAFLSLACVPFPFLFSRYGARIRKHCPYSASAMALAEKMSKGSES